MPIFQRVGCMPLLSVALVIFTFTVTLVLSESLLVAISAGSASIALRWWRLKTRAFYASQESALSIKTPARNKLGQSDRFVIKEKVRASKSVVQEPENGAKESESREKEPDYRNSSSYKKLLLACSGNKATVDRLIAYELKKDPKLSPAAAVASALERLQFDRR